MMADIAANNFLRIQLQETASSAKSPNFTALCDKSQVYSKSLFKNDYCHFV
jgi:hypothetical protein